MEVDEKSKTASVRGSCGTWAGDGRGRNEETKTPAAAATGSKRKQVVPYPGMAQELTMHAFRWECSTKNTRGQCCTGTHYPLVGRGGEDLGTGGAAPAQQASRDEDGHSQSATVPHRTVPVCDVPQTLL